MIEPTTTAAPHEHEWRDTGFATVEDCECGATRSGDVVTDPGEEIAAIYRRLVRPSTQERGDLREPR